MSRRCPTGLALLLCLWVFFTMDSQPDGTQLWKPQGVAMSAERCRAEVRRRSDRGPIAPVSLIGWYVVPGTGTTQRVGCLPQGYNPYEPR